MNESNQNMLLGVTSGLPLVKLKDARLLSPLALAYIGDTVYDLYVRTLLVEGTDLTAHGLHTRSSHYVCAAAQAKAFNVVEGMLNDDEMAIFKRGRNAHMGTIAKNASIADYRAATGFEALLGYLYLSSMDARLNELMRAALSFKGE